MGAELVQGDLCYPKAYRLHLISLLIDAATSRPTDSLTIKQVDWEGSTDSSRKADIERFIFLPFWMLKISRCTVDGNQAVYRAILAEADLNYTILRLCGFMQGLIGQYAIPILERQAV